MPEYKPFLEVDVGYAMVKKMSQLYFLLNLFSYSSY